jgi:hypothetical protein
MAVQQAGHLGGADRVANPDQQFSHGEHSTLKAMRLQQTLWFGSDTHENARSARRHEGSENFESELCAFRALRGENVFSQLALSTRH